MKTNLQTLTLIAGAVLIATASMSVSAGPFNRSGSGSYTTSGGHSGRYDREIRRTDNGIHQEQSITTDSGRTFSRSADTSYDRESGQINRSTTGIRGQTRTSTGSIDRENRSYDRTITTSRGRTIEGSTQLDRENRSLHSTYTTEGGRSVNVDRAANDSHGTDTTVTGSGGRSTGWSTSNSRDPESGVVRHSVTGNRGNTRYVDIDPD